MCLQVVSTYKHIIKDFDLFLGQSTIDLYTQTYLIEFEQRFVDGEDIVFAVY